MFKGELLAERERKKLRLITQGQNEVADYFNVGVADDFKFSAGFIKNAAKIEHRNNHPVSLVFLRLPSIAEYSMPRGVREL